MVSDFTLAPSARRASPAAHIVSPSLMRALCRPVRYARSEAVRGLPLLFWLIDACRPSSYVSLGLGDGTSYFAACQAMERQDHNARCYGFGVTENPAAGELIEIYNEENYSDFSKIYLASTLNPVELRVGDIDLLHINLNCLNLEPDALKTWVGDWMGQLSEQAVVLIQGGKNDEPLSAMLELMLKQARPDRPSIDFARDQGFILLLYGKHQSDLLVKLTELRFGEAGYTEIQYVFSRLGQLHYKEWAHREVRDELIRTQDALVQAEGRKTAIENEQALLAERLEKINHAYDDRSNRTASLQAMLFDMQNDLTGKVAELSERDRALADARAKAESLQLAVAERDRSLAAAEQASEAANAELESLKTATAERERSLAAAEHASEAAKAELESLKTATAERDRTLAGAEQAVVAARAELEALERRTKEITTETKKLKTSLAEERDAREAARQQVNTRFQELALLTRKLEEREQLLTTSRATEARARAECNRLKDEVEAKDQHILDLQTRLTRVIGHYQKIRSTRSWRITAPVRNLGKLVRKIEK